MHVWSLVLCVALSVIASYVLRDVSVKRLAPHEDDILLYGSADAALVAQSTDPNRPHQVHVMLRGMSRGSSMSGALIALIPVLLTSWPGIAPWKAVLVTAVAMSCWALPVFAARRPLLGAYAKSRGIAVNALKKRGRVRTTALQLAMAFWPAVLATVLSRNLDVRLLLALVGYAVVNPLLGALLVAVTIRITAPDLAGQEVAERVTQLASVCEVDVATPRIVKARARKMANAHQVGWLPGLKYLAISDYLIDEFTGSELDAIIAHELAHARLRHSLVRSLIGSFLVAAFWIMILNLVSGANNPGVGLGALAGLLVTARSARSIPIRQEVAADDSAHASSDRPPLRRH